METYYIGYDIGAISVNRAIVDKDFKIIDVLPYTRHFGEPVKVIEKDMLYLAKNSGIEGFYGIAFTGSGGKAMGALLGCRFINEIEAIITAINFLYPDIKTVIEIGGQDSKFIDLAAGDYAMNELCAAGTGSFLDQQASRFNLTIEQFSELALRSKNPATIAGRCSVFAKSDMIHLQQEAASDEDIALGLCYAMARSFKSGIVKGKDFLAPIAFCGGVSYNSAMIRAFKDILGQEIFIPENQSSIGAIGAALNSANQKGDAEIDLEAVLEKLADYLANFTYQKETFKPLVIEKSILLQKNTGKYVFDDSKKTDAFLGIDVGSISTNVVAIDANKNLLSKVYLRTAGRPIEAVRQGVRIIGEEIGDKINVRAVGTTGSGRYLIGDLVGADTIVNEITAQATAAANIDKEVDTIFEIGGQDSKYIALERGVIVDFEMNKICAAGTGSFLEEQSERFDINIEDFGDVALTAPSPLNLGERCTVFMETNVYSHYQNGATIENILAGLAYSIAINYINRVVGRKKIGNRIFFQGAVAFNKSVIAAFENYLGKQIIVPENHEVTGAIGTAIRAMENMPSKSGFRGFEEVSNIRYSQNSFECNGCPNVCQIKKVSIDGAKPLFYGGRCEKYEKKKSEKAALKDLFKIRDDILLNSYSISKHADVKNKNMVQSNLQKDKKDMVRIGIPFTMLTYEFYPFWEAYFNELGMEVVLSDKTNRQIINDGLGYVVAESCFPIKVVLGHVQNLLDKGVDYIFIPSIRDMPCDDKKIEGYRTGSYPCPFIQGISSFVKSSMNISGDMILDPLINFSFKHYLKNVQLQKLGKRLGRNKASTSKAVDAAFKAQSMFYEKLRKEGRSAIADLGDEEMAAVIISRPYNSCDANISMDIPGKLRDLGIQAIPLDFLPLEDTDIFNDWPNMYWEFGDRILSAIKIIKKDKRLFPVYITNFGCGPDSFIMQYFEREIDRPFLKIEVDEHTAGAGVITRCEAFYDSLRNIRRLKDTGEDSFKEKEYKEAIFKKKENRKIYIPYMGDGAYAIQAAFQYSGIDADIMMADQETLELGRKYTLGKECYPYILTTGDILKTLKHNDPKKCAFFMPLTHGPCRFGQYNKMQKILLQELGYSDVPIIAPGAPENNQFYKEYDMQGKKGAALLFRALAGAFTIDYLAKYLYHIRPYEVESGSADSVYNELIEKTVTLLKNPANKKIIDSLTLLLDLAEIRFSSIEVNRTSKPLIGIVGEIYVRNHPFSNNEIIKKVESLGGEAQIPDFGEWSYHTNATSKLDNSIKQKDLYYRILAGVRNSGHRNGKNGRNSINSDGIVRDNDIYSNSKDIFEIETAFSDLGKLIPNYAKGIRHHVTNRFFKGILHKYHKQLQGPLSRADTLDCEEADIYDIWDNAEPYIIKWFGEAALSVGKSIHWIKKGADGIVNVLPFTCMPGTMVTAISRRIREEYNVPWLNLSFDGLEQGTTETRLEAFMYQAKQHKSQKTAETSEKIDAKNR